jgi:hypothetical protein
MSKFQATADGVLRMPTLGGSAHGPERASAQPHASNKTVAEPGRGGV